jgi:hypothetical protein
MRPVGSRQGQMGITQAEVSMVADLYQRNERERTASSSDSGGGNIWQHGRYGKKMADNDSVLVKAHGGGDLRAKGCS